MLDFPKVNRSIITGFNSNYLKTVVFQLKFANTPNIIDKKDVYLPRFKDLFPRINESQQNGFAITINKDQTPILQPIPSEKNGIELRSEDGQKIIAFLKDGITFTIAGASYKNFENIINELELIFKVLTDIDVTIIERIAIRKINIVDFEIPPNLDGIDSISVMELILHPELLNNISYFPNKNNISQSIHNVVFTKDDVCLNLKYGMIQQNILEKKGQVLLDIDLIKQGKFDAEQLVNIFNEINEEIFNIFNWAMNRDAIDHLMEKK